jgi:error-prone DNA polymerase
LYGAIRFVEVARHHGLNPILGAEVTHEHHRAVLLAKTPEGYANLCRLLSARHSDDDFELVGAVAHYRRGVVVCSDDLAALMAWKKLKVRNLYVELTPGKMMHQALAFSRRSGIPPVATSRTHFVHQHDFAVHRMLRAIALNTTLSQLPQDECCAPHHWLAPASVLEPQYPHIPHALTNTRRIARSCYTEWNFKETIFPAFRELSDRQAFILLKEKTYQGAIWRYGAIRPEVHTRIHDELAVIQSKGFAHSFLVVEEIVRQAPRTCGRGSAAASIVSYCLGITHVDPIRHNLFFERFLNVGRHDPPDIDIDFPWDERDRILDFVFAHYGADRVAMVANHNTLALRAAIREVAKVHGIPSDEISRIVPQLFRYLDFHQIHDTISLSKGLRAICRSQRWADPWPEVLSLAVRVQGRFQRLGLHCGGVVIVPDEIRRYVPVQVAAKGIPMIQWEKDQTEDAGLLKLDLLGNRSLAVIRDAIEAIARNTGNRLDYATWDPLSDVPTQSLIRRGDTIGCFYIESPATRLLLKKLWTGMSRERREVADLFEYLVIVSSLVRPAANRYIREFVRRAHGHPYQPLHPQLEDVLKETHGIMVYQEDVTKVAMVLAGFDIEDADQLRKVLTKKHKQRQLQDYKAQFFRETQARGVSHSITSRIWDMIMSFAGYSFCKPHSASYAQVSFKSAYLRAHYPAEFMAAVISNQGGFYSAFAYLSEGRRMGLTVLPPDINASEWHYTGDGQRIRMG